MYGNGAALKLEGAESYKMSGAGERNSSLPRADPNAKSLQFQEKSVTSEARTASRTGSMP